MTLGHIIPDNGEPWGFLLPGGRFPLNIENSRCKHPEVEMFEFDEFGRNGQQQILLCHDWSLVRTRRTWDGKEFGF